METLSVLRFDRLSAYLRLMRLHRPIGSLLLLWPTLWALWIASAGHPRPVLVAVFVALRHQQAPFRRSQAMRLWIVSTRRPSASWRR